MNNFHGFFVWGGMRDIVECKNGIKMVDFIMLLMIIWVYFVSIYTIFVFFVPKNVTKFLDN